MKKCPQCNTVYENQTIYCLNDGTQLIEENFALPTTAMNLGEEETVIHREPIVIDIEKTHPFLPQKTHPFPPQTVNIAPPITNEISAKPKSKAGSYLFILLVGLVIGGGAVLFGILYFNNFFQPKNPPVANVNTNVKPTKSPTPINTKHLETNKLVDESELNGQVIKTNAYVRSAPDANASIVDTLPMNDRLKIGERENENSPWYQVTCEHGTTGWMHGNTIEFAQ